MKNKIKKKTNTSLLVALLCTGLLILSIFLPYVTAEADYAEILESMEQDKSLSLYDFAVLYLEENESSFVKVLSVLGCLVIMSALFAVLRKPVVVMILDILTVGLTAMIRLLFSDVPYGYVLSIGSWLCFVGCVGLFGAAIWMLVAKNKAKKEYTKIR